MNILFFKKFGGNSEKERIIIFVMESCDKMDWCNQDKYLYLRIPCYNRNTSVLILHEKITVISIIGTVLILIGLVISQKN